MLCCSALLLLAPPQADFAPAILVAPDADAPRMIQAVDIDGDGDLDLIVTGSQFGAVRLYANVGGGAFDTGRTLASGAADAFGVDSGDIDGDGDLDLVRASILGGNVGWLPNLGDGEFGPPVVLTGGAASARHVRAADIDGDGDLDLVASSDLSPEVVWFEGLGAGALAPAAVLASGHGGVIQFDVGDLDGDGDLDLVGADYVADEVLVWHQVGGAFGSALVVASGVADARFVTIHDIDGDGLQDIVVGAFTADSVAWYRGLGAGAYSSALTIATAVDQPLGLAVRDVDADGDADVVSASSTQGLRLHRNLGSGVFATAEPFAASVRNASSVDIADLDGDGHLDVAATSRHDNGVAVVRGDGLGGFDSGTKVNIFGDITLGVRAADLDGDGDEDVLVRGYQSNSGAFRGSELIYANNGASGLQPPTYALEGLLGVTALRDGLGDLDGDGDLDIVVGGLPAPQTLAWMENLGGGSFASPAYVSSSNGFHYLLPATGDLDGDGDVDLVASLGSAGAIAWWPNSGNGALFGPERPIPTTGGAVTTSFDVIDLDADGDLDLVQGIYSSFTHPTNSGVAWYENLGAGTFGARRPIRIGTLDTAYAVADIDGDGDLDVYTLRSRTAAFVWHEQVAQLNWIEHILATVPGTVTDAHSSVIDLDDDGDLDVVSTTGLIGDPAYWFENLGGGAFAPEASLGDWGGTQVVGVDFDGDGDRDLFFENRYLYFVENLRIVASIGVPYCHPAVPNSTGVAGSLGARGSTIAAANRLTLVATDLPSNALTLFLASRLRGFVTNPGGSAGNLCLASPIGRGVGGIVTSGAGAVEVTANLGTLPQPMGVMPATIGSTWNFQCWHRDSLGGGATSNFTNGVSVRFR